MVSTKPVRWQEVCEAANRRFELAGGTNAPRLMGWISDINWVYDDAPWEGGGLLALLLAERASGRGLAVSAAWLRRSSRETQAGESNSEIQPDFAAYD